MYSLKIILNFLLIQLFKNNLKLNAERKNQKSIKQNLNISRSEFLPSISLSGNQTSTQSTNKFNQSGASLPDSSLDSEKKIYLSRSKNISGI